MKKETPNCAKCKWKGVYFLCWALGAKSISAVYGSPTCKRVYEPKDEEAK